MGQAQKPEVTQSEINEAKNLWHNFTEFTKWSVLATIVVLALMALFLL